MEHVEPKTVRDARGEARRMSRKGRGSYQQCLDAVARERGHDHWAAFSRSQPQTPITDIEGDPRPEPDAKPIRKAFKPPIPYEEWKAGIQTMTRDQHDERRVDAVARRADRIAERTGLPLRVIGLLPFLMLMLANCITMIATTGLGNALSFSVTFILPVLMVGFGVNALGNCRMLGGMRSSMEDFVWMMKILILVYALIHISMLIGPDPKVAAFATKHLATPMNALKGVIVAFVLIHLVGYAIRWMFVVATRHPPAMPDPLAHGARVA